MLLSSSCLPKSSNSSRVPMNHISQYSIVQLFVKALFHKLCSSQPPQSTQRCLKASLKISAEYTPKETIQTTTSNSRSTPTINSLLQPFKMTPHHHPQTHYNKPLLTNYSKIKSTQPTNPHSKSNPKHKKMCRVHFPEYLGCGCPSTMALPNATLSVPALPAVAK